MQSNTILISVLALCGSALSRNYFISPPEGQGADDLIINNPIYTEGDEVQFSWNTEYVYTDIKISQKYPKIPTSDGKSYGEYLQSNFSFTYFKWIAKMSLNGGPPPEGEKAMFWLEMYKVQNTSGLLADSHYFNVSRPFKTISSQTSISTSTVSSTTSASTSGEQAQKSLSTGAVAGIAIGATLAGMILVAFCAFMLWRHFQSKQNNNTATDGPNGSSSNGKETAGPNSELAQSLHTQPDPSQHRGSLPASNHQYLDTPHGIANMPSSNYHQYLDTPHGIANMPRQHNLVEVQ